MPGKATTVYEVTPSSKLPKNRLDTIDAVGGGRGL
jgi:hypothetical protein